MDADNNKLIGTTKSGTVVTTDNVDEVINKVFAELRAGRASVQSRSKSYYEVVIPFAKLPDELKQALVCLD